MKKGFLLRSLLLLIVLTGCEGTAKNNFIADIFIGNEWTMFFLSVILMVPSIFAVTSEQGLLFYAAVFRRRRRFWQSRELTEHDLTMAKFSAYLTLIAGGFIFLFSVYYLIF